MTDTDPTRANLAVWLARHGGADRWLPCMCAHTDAYPRIPTPPAPPLATPGPYDPDPGLGLIQIDDGWFAERLP